MTTTLTALLGFVAWALLLLIVMEAVRTGLVFSKAVEPTSFRPDNANLSPFMQRLTRAHANCVEGIPIFGGLMLIAVISGNSHATDPLAYYFLGARIFQSLVHMSSVSATAITVRFAAFTVQMVIAAWWVVQLL